MRFILWIAVLGLCYWAYNQHLQTVAVETAQAQQAELARKQAAADADALAQANATKKDIRTEYTTSANSSPLSASGDEKHHHSMDEMLNTPNGPGQ